MSTTTEPLHKEQQPSPSFVTPNNSINRKVAFASVGAALGSIISLFLATFLLNLPFLANISPEDKGTLKTSLTSGITALVTLLIGFQTKPGAGDGIAEEKNSS
ncbi:MAG: hypothetical protein GPJ01_17460 [Microcystis aeruginosa LL13-06]|nr:hypothetical protein [Microcystis aeruginosa LL13-06]